MKRRDFIFGSLKAAALLSPVLSIRRAEAQVVPPMRAFFWVNPAGYPVTEDAFPAETGSNFTLPVILAGLDPLKSDLVTIDGISIAETGHDTNGNNHVRTVGKVMTAKDIIEDANAEDGGVPGDISIDQLLARDLGWPSLEVLVEERDRGGLRERPFSLGPGVYKVPFAQPSGAWQRAFADFSPNQGEEERLDRLRRKRSVLDDLTKDLARFRRELDGIERTKLDIHEDAIRRAELSVQRDIDNAPAQCAVPSGADDNPYIPIRAAAHFDVMFAALACGRARIGSMMWGHSGFHWRYDWTLGNAITDSIHDEVHHRDGERRTDFSLAAQWDWTQLSAFAQRLKATPEGTGTMLDNTLVAGISHFGHHHSGHRIPVVLIGNAQGRLQTGRAIRLAQDTDNSLLLTTIAHLCGHPIPGFGDSPNCGTLSL